MTDVVVPNVTLKVLSTLLKVMSERNWDSQPIDMTLSLAIGHMNIA